MRYSVAAFLLCVFSGTALAQTTTVPNTFTAGTAAVAAEVNADFKALATAIDSGIPGYEIDSVTFPVPSTMGSTGAQGQIFDVYCTSGKLVLSGGYNVSGQALVPESMPTQNVAGNNGWEVQVDNNIANSPLSVQVFAICAIAHP